MAGGSTHYPASSPTAVITPAATYYAFFVGDGTGGTTLGVLYKKDSSAVVTPVVAAAANAFGAVTGTTGTATADSSSDTIAITGANGISTAATDTPDGLVVTGPNLFGVVTGNAGTATADVTGDTLAITGSGQASTTATDTPDGLVISVPLLTGPITSAAGGATSVTNNAITNAMLAQAPTLTLKGNNTGVTANVTDLTLTQLAAMGVGGLTGWIDVTKQATPVLAANAAATNNTNLATILAAAPSGSTIYFPGGIYNFASAWTLPASKQFTFQGQGNGIDGANTLLNWSSNVAGTFITLTASQYYWQFQNLTFTSSVTQTAGYVVDVNGNATTNFYRCTFGIIGSGLLAGCLTGTAANSWNTAIIEDCNFSKYTGIALNIDSALCSLVVKGCQMQGQYLGSPTTVAASMAVAGIATNNCGALQVSDCDLIGHQTNLLLAPASGKVTASVQVTNTYFDNAGVNGLSVTGAGATVRCKLSGCTFTTAGASSGFSTPPTGLTAVSIAGTFAFAAGGQDISLHDCNVLNTFGTTGTTNGISVSGSTADLAFPNCKVAGWTNGYSIATTGTNVSHVKILGGACGPSGGYGANTVGFNIAAGAYKGLCIQNVNAHGNTTNLTLGAVTVLAADASLFRITDNTGINPRGAVTTPGVPTAGTTVTNTTGFRVLVYAKNGATAPTAWVINGVSVAATSMNSVASTGANGIPLDPGGTIAFTTTTAGAWTWVGQ